MCSCQSWLTIACCHQSDPHLFWECNDNLAVAAMATGSTQTCSLRFGMFTLVSSTYNKITVFTVLSEISTRMYD